MSLSTLKTNSEKYKKSYSTDGNNFSKYADDPVGFIEIELGEKLTEEQKAIAQSLILNLI